MEMLLQHLKLLGFTELEAKCLYVLTESGTLTGYELAKRLGASRSNVYSALQKLTEKGVVLASVGEPMHYSCLPVDEIGEKLQTDIQASIRFVKANMPRRETQRADFFSLEGDAKIMERLRSELKACREEAFCDLWSEEAGMLGDELRQLQERSVRVLVSLVGGGGLPEGVKALPHERDDAWQERNGRKFSLLLDRRLAIIGTRGGAEPAKAMLTEHPAMTELLLNNFYHDMVMHELLKDMGPELESRYGKHFEAVVRKYIT
ncbi:TrmB family transcriptional regulator [Paenibacillus hamazuiensis]|uniref:TrmB family transcriptional regulator n=1 Tax=Paenibacillus hamazuiensis TaxID=2936508 RepID=UPI00200C25A2|nr:helix-turn-helix domain-containing protein [Paenibacillus hamazuiensis]